MQDPSRPSMSRRELLQMIGVSAGGAAMYAAMTSLGLAGPSPYKGPVKLQGAPKGTSVLVLGAGVAGMAAAMELRDAGYTVKVLEYNQRPGGRNWSLYGGDTYTELGGATQRCEFDEGLYVNPGPWRIPHHHTALLGYCRRLGVALEPFIQVNYNAYMHNPDYFGGKPQRFRAIRADYHGHVAELLGKSLQQHALDGQVTREDQEKLLESLRRWGALDERYAYTKGEASNARRGYLKDPSGGLSARPQFSEPLKLGEILDSNTWAGLLPGETYEWQTTMFQPVGGMGMIGKAFGRALEGLIQYNAKVTAIQQDTRGVTVSYEDTTAPGQAQSARADWCLCTIPLSILSQLPMNVGPKMEAAIAAVPYSASVKIGLQFKRRFWEEDEQIYGGITYTSLPISNISYPSCDYYSRGKGVLLGAFSWAGLGSAELASMSPAERIAKAVEYGSQIHPQYKQEFENGISVAWHRSPFSQGCSGVWTEETRHAHYDNLCQIDGRIALAGEHASFLPGWQEGSITSALDAIERIHRRVVAGGKA